MPTTIGQLSPVRESWLAVCIYLVSGSVTTYLDFFLTYVYFLRNLHYSCTIMSRSTIILTCQEELGFEKSSWYSLCQIKIIVLYLFKTCSEFIFTIWTKFFNSREWGYNFLPQFARTRSGIFKSSQYYCCKVFKLVF